MAKTRKVNWALLKKCRDLFDKKPSKALMYAFVQVKDGWEGRFDEDETIPMCKTHLCIGGSALLLSGKYTLKQERYGISFIDAYGVRPRDTWKAAKLVLGLSVAQATRLFDENEWPYKFTSVDNALGSRTLARNMVARIDHFIKTKGRE